MAASVGYLMVAAAAGSGCGGCWWGLARSRVPVTWLPTWTDWVEVRCLRVLKNGRLKIGQELFRHSPCCLAAWK
jgi:hypothetical protein